MVRNKKLVQKKKIEKRKRKTKRKIAQCNEHYEVKIANITSVRNLT